jgi:hypothetical protein
VNHRSERSDSDATLPPRLVAITPPDGGLDLCARIAAMGQAAAPDGRRVGVLVRAPDLDLGAWEPLLAALVPVVRAAGLRLGVNVGRRGDPEHMARFSALAAAWAPDWLQIPERSAPLATWRQSLGASGCSGVALSRSCHDAAGVARAFAARANWVMVSPVCATASKPASAPLGMAGLGRLVSEGNGPVVALGGVDADNAAACLALGAAGVAAIRAAWAETGALFLRRCLDHPKAP